jgi:hypothetical protein
MMKFDRKLGWVFQQPVKPENTYLQKTWDTINLGHYHSIGGRAVIPRRAAAIS